MLDNYLKGSYKILRSVIPRIFVFITLNLNINALVCTPANRVQACAEENNATGLSSRRNYLSDYR